MFMFVSSCLFRTIRREWTRLDQYRLDKYYSLVRLMVREMLNFAKAQKWSKKALDNAYLPMDAEALQQSWPNGIRLHLCDIILAELAHVAGDSIDTQTFMLLIAPFFELLGR